MPIRFTGLDGLRAVAILWVILFHYLADETKGTAVGAFLHMGYTGVDLFFVVSGFLVSGILMDARDKEHYFRKFYLRRAYRIIPPFYLLVIGCSVAVKIFVPNYYGERHPFWVYLLFINDIWAPIVGNMGWEVLAVTWSLALEEKIYLFMPLVIKRIQPKHLARVFAAALVLLSVWRFGSVALGWLSTESYWFKIEADGLFWGVLLAIAYRSPTWKALTNHPVLRYGTLILSGSIAFWPYGEWSGPQDALPAFFQYFYLNLFFILSVGSVLMDRASMLSRILRTGPLVKIGMLSYGLYLYHRACQFFVPGIAKKFVPSLTGNFPVLITISFLSTFGARMAIVAYPRKILYAQGSSARVLSLHDFF